MNLDYYRNFVTIVDCGTISSAANKLLIAQSALSTQIKTLEKTYGTTLLIRNARSVVPTDAGKILYDKARYMITIEDAISKELNDCARGMRGTLWLGMSTPPDQHLSQLLYDFSKANPGVVFEFYETNAQQLIELLSSGILEVAIIRASPNSFSSILHTEITLSERLCVVFTRDNPWGISDNIDFLPLSKLDNIPLSFSKGFRALIHETFSQNHIEPNIFSVSTTRDTGLMWAQKGVSVAIIPCASTDLYINEKTFCCQLDSSPIVINRCFCHLNDKELSLIAKSFLTFAAEWLNQQKS